MRESPCGLFLSFHSRSMTGRLILSPRSDRNDNCSLSCRIVNRFIKKGSRTPDYDEKKVFGVPLSLILQRTGQPLPQCILHAMRYLRKSAPDSVGIFRKSGVKSRIQKLRNDLEQDPGELSTVSAPPIWAARQHPVHVSPNGC